MFIIKIDREDRNPLDLPTKDSVISISMQGNELPKLEWRNPHRNNCTGGYLYPTVDDYGNRELVIRTVSTKFTVSFKSNSVIDHIMMFAPKSGANRVMMYEYAMQVLEKIKFIDMERRVTQKLKKEAAL